MSGELFHLVAGHPALDFANTLDNRFAASGACELLNTYDDLLRFARQSELLPAGPTRNLARLPVSSQLTTLARARTLRESLERIFSAVACKANVDGAELRELERWARKAFAARELCAHTGGAEWRWKDFTGMADAPLLPIAASAADLLISSQAALVRECGEATCRWLFLDTSKNHSRRWCDMALCGNRTKARRFQQAHSDPATSAAIHPQR